MSPADQEFVRAFENCELTADRFHHRDHIRLAWIYVRRYGEAEAETRIAAGIRRFAAHLGVSEKYHQTITVAWLRLVAEAERTGHDDYEDFTRSHPALFDKAALNAYYSEALLQSPGAREQFVEPDLRPLSDPGPR